MVEAVAAVTATADATAGKFLVTLSNQIGGQQVGLLPYFFVQPSGYLAFSSSVDSLDADLIASHVAKFRSVTPTLLSR